MGGSRLPGWLFNDKKWLLFVPFNNNLDLVPGRVDIVQSLRHSLSGRADELLYELIHGDLFTIYDQFNFHIITHCISTQAYI